MENLTSRFNQRWPGCFVKQENDDIIEVIMLIKTEGTKERGRSKGSQMDCMEGDLKILGGYDIGQE